ARGRRTWPAQGARHRPGPRRDDRRSQQTWPREHVYARGPRRRTAGGRRMKILVVDDEPDVVESVRLGFTLQWRDVDVLGAGEGEAALDVVEREHPDIVLLDVGLPG